MNVSILPRLATGISLTDQQKLIPMVSILPRLATGIEDLDTDLEDHVFLFFPVLRRGSEILRR